MTGKPAAPINPLVRLGELGQSPWYDYITRDLVTTGELARLIAEDGLRGMTSNPTIFEKAIAGSRLYDEDIRAEADAGRSPQQIFEHLAVADVQAACDAFAGLYRATGGADGLVSLEVSPALANDTAATIQEAERLWRTVKYEDIYLRGYEHQTRFRGLPVTHETLRPGPRASRRRPAPRSPSPAPAAGRRRPGTAGASSRRRDSPRAAA